jgi:hypothetical protein
VNGYVCWNCQQVSEAKKDINPVSPVQPGGAPSPSGATRPGAAAGSSNASPQSSVVFGGVLAQMVANTSSGPAAAATSPSSATSVGLNIFA